MRLPALSVGALELRRLGRHKLTMAALASLLLLPLLYAGLYLWSFWDPYSRLGHVPVALVNDDRPAGRVHAGADLASELKDRRVFAWKSVDAAAARDGLAHGRYYMVLTIPSDFSARINAPSGSGTPSPAGLRLDLDDANNYVVGTLAQSAFKEISAAAGAKATRTYLDQIFLSFGTLHDKLDQAARGADKLADGSGKAHDGAGELAAGLKTAKDGSAQLTSGLGELQDGTRQVAAGTGKLAAFVDRTSDTIVPLLRDHAPEIRDAALLVARGADALAANAGALPQQTRAAVRQAEQARDELRATLAARPDIPANVRENLLRASDRVVALARQVDGYVRAHTADLRALAADARTIAQQARKVAAAAPGLAAKVQNARADVDRLNAGAHRINTGTGQLLAGSTQLTGGLGTLSGGAVTLGTALAQIADGNRSLASGLDDGVRQVPDYGAGERAGRADMMSDPVRLTSVKENPAPNYGTGFAPFFIPLALWVGAMFVYMMLRPLGARALASTAPAWRVALAGWLPGAAVGAGQVLVLLGVLHFALGLDAVRWPGLIAFLVLAAAAFQAIVQWANARFGPVGRVIALALLMLQLTSAAGTYPIETSPGFFGAIRPFLPMSWVVDGVRRLVSGGDLTPVWQGGAVLAAFLAGALALTALAARRGRVWTMARLHPALRL
ncbi:ABC-2 family transporter protein [Actinomadura rubteroloni]|uniref:ABC-2 family transporter protein n=1 Tax=Actinomadura rubteroloni TaxID=1926885 RepID=A0A2P4UQX9_9ACTN|nr:YhgE/Pip domain-containing protein [Actinomadura rubteroloni]POM27448.1 ABC-2 family transporter protein [Actinomadura rubteroloni]